MENKFKEIKDIIFSFVVAVVVMKIGSLLKINNEIIQYFVTKVMPLLIMTYTVIKNKPSVYLKYFTFRKKSKNIQFNFILKYSEIIIDDKSEYKNIIDKFIEKYKGGDIKILRQNIGSEVCITSFIINSVNYEINYDDIGESLELIITSQLNYRNFFDKVEKAASVITDISAASKLKFNREFTKINIDYLDDKELISNPFFKKVYTGFDLKSAEIKFITKKNTTVRLGNSCIGFTSNENATELIKDMKTIISI
ncbi:MAG: hypothetical protein LKH93_06750 [Clostridium beijerinckii]|nr:hypothetical protein [Clostridium beijerinckii]MCI1578612.1 hypothetical protein [Clostridium beijerinckii]MCI1582056.1 hypothetical protein [Clostridium beijerinckii]MCI1621906.1 hypothetical protein [Clostridium beijerinckii]